MRRRSRSTSQARHDGAPVERPPEARVLRGREVDAHQRRRPVRRVEQRAGREQPAVVEHELRQPLGVDADVDPAEQPARRRRRSGSRRASASLTVRARAASSLTATRSAWRRSEPCSRQSASACSVRLGVVSVVSSLVSINRSTSAARRGEEADAPVRRQDLREARDVDRALQPVERRQARQVRRREVRVGVVLDDLQVVRLRQLQHPVRAPERQRCAGRVVQHRHRDVQARAGARAAAAPSPRGRGRRRRAAPAARACPARPAARTRPTSRARRPAPVAGAQQRARDDVERMRRADRGDDLRRRRRHAVVGEPRGERAAQPHVAGRVAVLQRQRAELRAAC